MERLLLGIKVLEQSGVAHYLLSLGVVKPRDVIDDGFAVVDASRRNCVFLASTPAGATFVIKQGSASSLANEAHVLRLLGRTRELGRHVPEVVHQDEGRLVLRTAAGARDWADHHGRFPRIPARILGRVLARLHGLRVDAPRGADPIWGLDLAEPPHELVIKLSAGARDLLARIQANGEICGRLAEVRDTSTGISLVHGDLRWENCLALPAPGARRRTRVLLVDWELAGGADPAYDVGSVIAEYLRVWVGSVPIAEAVEPGRLAEHARHPLAAMRPAIHALWSSYAHTHPDPPALPRVMELTGVRLLQTAIERAQGLGGPAAHVVTLVQLAGNFLRSPEGAAARLLWLRA